MEHINVSLILLLIIVGMSYAMSFYAWRYRFIYGLWLFWSVAFIGITLQIVAFLLYEGLDIAMISAGIALLCILVSLIAFKFFEIVPAAKSLAVENMEDGILVLDTKDRILDMNAQLEKILGIKKVNVVGVVVERIAATWLVEAIQGEKFQKYTTMLQQGESYYEVNSTPLQHRGKNFGRVIVLCDVTSRMLAEQRFQQLLQSEEKLLQTEALAHMMFNHHQAMMMIIESKTGHILEANAAAENFYESPLIGCLIQEFIEYPPDEHGEKNSSQYANVGEYQFMARHALASGEVKDLSVNLTTKVIGEMVLSFLILEDFTEKMQLEKALREAKEKAEKANQAKDDFLAIISHELRTPMNGILGMAKLVLGTKLQPDQRECLELVQVSGEKLLVLLNDLLDFSKVRDGKLELENICFSLRDVMSEFHRILRMKAKKKGLQCVIHIAQDVPDGLYGDPRRLQQIVMNLADNAVKFTKTGLVSIAVNVKQHLDNQVNLLFVVRDTGIGIPPEKINIIFHKFTQVDSSTTRKYGGTGLGLSIVKHLVEIMGGRVWVESSLDKGSSFYFTVSFEVCQITLSNHPLEQLKQPESNKELQRIEKLQVLLVEDEFINQKVAVKMLTNQGHNVTLASNGQQAIEFFNKEQFDIIFMDIQMPEMDGVQTTAAIRDLEEQWADERHIPIVAMTAYAMKGDRERLMSCGMDEYISKPLDAEVLNNVVRKLFYGRYAKSKGQGEMDKESSQVAANPYLDQLLSICQGDVDTVKAVISCFLDNGTQYMRHIEQAVSEKDANHLKLSAHRLKGAATYFGNQTVVEYAAQLEQMGDAGQLIDIEQVFAKLQAAVKELEDGLQQAWRELPNRKE
ncbi:MULTISPECIES: ATP-binding protein [Pelosinus]|uniref:Circadian input-output histidine kinase CikA n=1 Tax=Pelosinus fermentans B4 TaxID=1149862 RepID=I8RAD2_9FIRM|nr:MULTISPECIES: ATP-binding protein [Pelosinus]EIW15833.1 PAS sensor protein [Pelosinus fermentans B4]EIW27461.1 multi-sensor hybrid histidine kinase [Pelosinus fermentans A11]OAM92582.1 multi-sensor hybrid histidine kinase [Pelosinus fermentans DSM 17108]SDQ49795.1 PAS domain S-box-containing protein [Pelosinus fermentans]